MIDPTPDLRSTWNHTLQRLSHLCSLSGSLASIYWTSFLDVIWELNALIGAGEGCGIERVRFGPAPRFTRSFYGVPV